MGPTQTAVDTRTLAAHLKARLQKAFGNRLRGVVLYESEARHDATPESDIDLLVLLAGPVALGQDLWTCIDALYPLQLEMGRPIHPLPVDATVYEKGEYALYRNARRDGVLVRIKKRLNCGSTQSVQLFFWLILPIYI